MNLSGRIKNLWIEKKLLTLILMLLCGAALVLMSFHMTARKDVHAKDIAYTEGSMEQRLSRVLSMIEGAGEVEVLIMQSETDVVGVLVVADGAENLAVRTELMRAAMTALDVPAESVEVFARKKEGE